MALSATAVSNAKPKEKPYKLYDERGLYLLVTERGSRYWRFNYRFEGKGQTLAFGVYPDVGLADARAKRDAVRKIIAAGDDPRLRRKKEAAEAQARRSETFDLIANEWIERLERQGRAEATLAKNRWLIDFARPVLGERPISEITALELLGSSRRSRTAGAMKPPIVSAARSERYTALRSPQVERSVILPMICGAR